MSDRPLRTHEVLQELRDISSMAIDHFEEKIAPSLKKAYCELPTRSLLNSSNVQYQSKYSLRQLKYDSYLLTIFFFASFSIGKIRQTHH